MKTAYLLGSLNRGGTETLMLDVFRNARSNKLDAIGIYRKKGVCESEFRESGVPVFQLKPWKNIIAYLFRLRTVLKKHKIEIVHAQQPLDALLAYFALTGTGIKIALTLHGFDYNENKTGKVIHQFILRRTNLNIYVSNYQKEYYTKKYRLKPEKQKVIYNGISFEKLSNHKSDIRETSLNDFTNSGQLRKELKLSPEILLLGTVGNFVSGRDQFTICRFLKLLHESGVDFHFLFVGKKNEADPSKYDECVNFVNRNNFGDNVHFLGSRNDVPLILNALDAFIYSTDHDTFGIAVVEALACGLPVFVNDWPVMTEITENGKLATIYRTRDETDLFHQFSLYLQDKKPFLDKANVASGIVHEKYSIEKHIQDLKKVYNLTRNK